MTPATATAAAVIRYSAQLFLLLLSFLFPRSGFGQSKCFIIQCAAHKWKVLKFVMQWRGTHTHTRIYTTVTTLFFGEWKEAGGEHMDAIFPLFRSHFIGKWLNCSAKTFVLEFPLYEQYSRFMAEWQLNSLTSLISYCVCVSARDCNFVCNISTEPLAAFFRSVRLLLFLLLLVVFCVYVRYCWLTV